MIKPEDKKTLKRYTSASTLALTELWLRMEAKEGWKLIDVKEGLFSSKYFFIKSKNCDEVYFGTVGFGSKEKNLSNTEISIFNYLRNKYHLKSLNNKKWCFWYKIKREHITDINDLKINMLIREKCISKSYNMHLWISGVCSLLCAALLLTETSFRGKLLIFAILFLLIFLIFLAKKINHNRTVKIAYKNFLEE